MSLISMISTNRSEVDLEILVLTQNKTFWTAKSNSILLRHVVSHPTLPLISRIVGSNMILSLSPSKTARTSV